MRLKIKLIRGTMAPKWNDDAGLDLYAAETVQLTDVPYPVSLGIATEFDPNYVAFLKDRSGLASAGVCTHGGVIDASYRGEWKVLLTGDLVIHSGDRIIQAVFLRCFQPTIKLVSSLGGSRRGVHGFGSSGI